MKKHIRIISIIMVLALILGLVPCTGMTANAASAGEFAGGTGTADDPYLIASKTHLNNVRRYPEANYKMINDIEFLSSDWNGTFNNSGGYWLPIDNFSGNFDGNGYSIDGLKMNRQFKGEQINNVWHTSKEYGLFGDITGNISNLTMSNVDITVTVRKITTSYGGSGASVIVGAVAGRTSGSIDNCLVSGKIIVTGETEITSATAGGIVGSMYSDGVGCEISNCYNEAAITGTFTGSSSSASIGGIAGGFTGKGISNCANKGKLYAKSNPSGYPAVGGIVGSFSSYQENGTIFKCYNFADVESDIYYSNSSYARAAGIAGWINRSGDRIVESGNFGEVSAYGLYAVAGGVVASVSDRRAEITRCFNTGTVSASDANSTKTGFHEAAGITVGEGTISQCFNSGEINANGNDYLQAGGISTCSFGHVSDCYNTGAVNAQTGASSSEAGGILEACPVTIEHCYNTGMITGTSVGAIAQTVYDGGDTPETAVLDCYYLDNMSVGVKSNSNGYTVETTRCTSDRMKQQSTFRGFDFSNIWMMGTGGYKYPQLRNNRHAGAELDDTCSKTGHLLISHTAKEETCTEAGWDTYNTCFICDYTTFKEIPATGHSYGDWEVIEEPSCTKAGKEAILCTTCGSMIKETILCDASTYPESDHNYTNGKTYNITFEYPGASSLQIKFSGNTETEQRFDYIYLYDADGTQIGQYTGTALQSQEFTINGNNFTVKLTSDGSVNKYGFSFEYIYAEIVDDTTVREAEPLGHDEITHEAKPACDEIGWNEYVTCSRCDYTTLEEIEPQGHELEEVGAVAPECEKDGIVKHYTCTKCNELFSDEDGTNEITAADTVDPATGHDLKRTEAVEENCEEDGNIEYYTCGNCGNIYSDEDATEEIELEDTVIEATGHSYGDWIIDTDAGCLEAGSKHKECANCDSEVPGTIEATGHDLKRTEAVEENCEEDGNIEYYTCGNCGNIYRDAGAEEEIELEDTVIKAPGHDLKRTEAVEENCEEDGNIEYYTCEDCGKIYSDKDATEEIELEDTVIPATGHDFTNDWKADEENHWRECACGAKIEDEEHDFDWIIDQEATEDAEGSKHEECEVCKQTRSEDTVIEKLPHTHKMQYTEAVEPKCEEDGNIGYYTCTKCKKLYSDEAGNLEITLEETVDPATGHSYGEWIVDEKATCTADGSKHKECSACGDVQTGVVEALGHNTKKTDREEAKCEADGNIEYYTCESCGQLSTDEAGADAIKLEETVIKATGHSYGEWIIDQNATCTTEGSRHRECAACGNDDMESIKVLGHDLDRTEEVKAKCEADGNIEYFTCERCQKLYSDEAATTEIVLEETVIKATGHDYSDWEIHKPATPAQAGEKYKECANCGNKITDVIEKVEALGFSGASLTLQDNLTINYKVKKSLFDEVGYKDPYVVFKLNGREVKVTAYKEDATTLSFDFVDIAPNQMNDTVYATLYADYEGVEYASETRDYSVATYCYNMLSKMSSDEYAKFRTLLVDLLNYGTESQIYTEYKLDSLVDASLTEAQRAWGTKKDRTFATVQDAAYQTIDNPTVSWKGAGLNLKDRVEIRMMIEADSIENLRVRVTSATGGEWWIPAEKFEPAGERRYNVSFSGLNAGQMNESVYFTVYDGDKAVSNTARYSIESYAYAQVNKATPDEKLVKIVKAMMKYGDSAYNYAH